jgi:Domain of unknown function (DUF4340)
MKATFVKTYAALAILGGLGAYLYFVESKQTPTVEGEKKKEKLFTFEKAKAREITLAPKGAEGIHLVKEGGSWKMTAPTSVAADGSEADSLVMSFEGLESDETIAETPAKLSDYGLETPQNSISVGLEGAKEPLTILLGDKTPDSSGVYAKLPSKPRVFTIASYAETSFAKKPFDLRDRSLFHMKRDAVKTVDISGPDGAYALARSDKGEWSFTKPLATRAGRWSVDSLLGTLENLKMESVAAEEAKDLKPFGLDKPTRTVAVGLADGSTQKIEIGSSPADKKYNVRDVTRSLVAVIPSALVDDLAKGMKELREKRVLDVAAYDVEAFDVEIAGSPKRIFVRTSAKDKDGIEASKWKRTVPDTKDLETNKVQDALFKIGGIETQEFIDAPGADAAYGLDAPALKVSVRYAGGKPAAWFAVGKKDGAVFARRPDDGSVLKLDPTKAEDLIKAFTDL